MRPVDILTFEFLSFLFSLTVIFIEYIPHAYTLLFIYVILIAALYLLIYLKAKRDGRLVRALYDLVFPVMAVLLIFDSLSADLYAI